MKFNALHIHRNVVVWVALTMLLGIMGNKMLFTHTHLKADGTFVVHAHPFADPLTHSGSESHSHNDCELDMSSFVHFFLSLKITSIPAVVQTIVCEYRVGDEPDGYSIPLISIENRGPPFS